MLMPLRGGIQEAMPLCRRREGASTRQPRASPWGIKPTPIRSALKGRDKVPSVRHSQDLGANMTAYPKRLIEVDLPIKRISAHARREKSIRHGHISTLHIWWARRPLAACRAVICAALWPDPADPICPQSFRDAASQLITDFAEKVFRTASLHDTVSPESFGQWEGIVKAKEQGLAFDTHDPTHLNKLRFALLDFIADFANWDNSTVPAYLETSRASPRLRTRSARRRARHPAACRRPICRRRFHPARSPARGCRRLRQRPQPGRRSAQQGRPGVHPQVRPTPRRRGPQMGRVGQGASRKATGRILPKDPDGATPIAYLVGADRFAARDPAAAQDSTCCESSGWPGREQRSVALRLHAKLNRSSRDH